MLDPIRFTVTLDDLRDTRRLRQRPMVVAGSGALGALGLLLWLLTHNPGGLVIVAFAVLALAEWRFPVFDRWFDRGRPDLGMECELRVDEAGITFHQTGAQGTYETTGHVPWSVMSAVREDNRAILIMEGRFVRVGIPKRAFPSSAAIDEFRSEVARRRAIRPTLKLRDDR